jgi:protein SCO1/2
MLSAYAAAIFAIAAKAGDSQPRALIRRSMHPCRIQRPGVGQVDRPMRHMVDDASQSSDCKIISPLSGVGTMIRLNPQTSGARAPLLLLLVCLVLAGCSKPQFNNIDISGASYARDFALTDAAGAPHTLGDYRGKVVVVFFGYTHCPDVCPTTLAQLAQARRLLGADGGRVQVLFVTLDPGRDTPPLLARYVQAFDPGFIALTGTEQQIEAAAREFKVFFQKVAGPTPDSYTLDHSSGSFVFDPQGHVRLYLRDGATADQIVPDLRHLLG